MPSWSRWPNEREWPIPPSVLLRMDRVVPLPQCPMHMCYFFLLSRCGSDCVGTVVMWLCRPRSAEKPRERRDGDWCVSKSFVWAMQRLNTCRQAFDRV